MTTAVLTWPRICPPVVQAQPSEMQAKAARLYPHSEHLQREWVRAVSVVRRTHRGWVLDQPVTRRAL